MALKKRKTLQKVRMKMQNNVEIIVRCSGKESTLSGEFLIGAVTQGDGEHGEKKAEALLAGSADHLEIIDTLAVACAHTIRTLTSKDASKEELYVKIFKEEFTRVLNGDTWSSCKPYDLSEGGIYSE